MVLSTFSHMTIICVLCSTIDREQPGFRTVSSCVDHINTLRIIIDQCADYRSNLHLVLVDFEKSFDNNISNMNLLKMADMQQIDVIIKRHKYGCIVHTLRKDGPTSYAIKSSGCYCKKKGQTLWDVERQCNANQIWFDMKQLVQSRVYWRVGVVDALYPNRDQGN